MADLSLVAQPALLTRAQVHAHPPDVHSHVVKILILVGFSAHHITQRADWSVSHDNETQGGDARVMDLLSAGPRCFFVVSCIVHAQWVCRG